MSGERKQEIAESPRRKAALAESRWIARRLFKVLVKVLREQPADRDNIEAWDPVLAEYLTRQDRPAKWLMNGETHERPR